MESEVSKSTTEILSLARKNLAEREAQEDAGETETEDEDDEMENCQVKMELIREEQADTVQSLWTEMEIEEEQDEKITVKVEEPQSGETGEERDNVKSSVDETEDQSGDNDSDVEIPDTMAADERSEMDNGFEDGDTTVDEGIHGLDHSVARRSEEAVDGTTSVLVAEGKHG